MITFLQFCGLIFVDVFVLFCFSRARLEAAPQDTLNMGGIEIKNKKYQDRTSRISDNLNPVYNFGDLVIKDDIQSKPKPLKPLIADSHLLQTRDIAGAYQGWNRMERREVKNTNTTQDIEGAQADTVKHSITSNRLTHPLVPLYQSLDDGSPLMPLNKPLIPSSIVKVPTLTPQQILQYQSTIANSSSKLEMPHATSSSISYAERNSNLDLLHSNSQNALDQTLEGN